MFVRQILAACAFVAAAAGAQAAVSAPFSDLGVLGDAAVSFGGFSRFEGASVFEVSYDFSLAAPGALTGLIGQAGTDFELIEDAPAGFTLTPIALEGIWIDGVAASTFVPQGEGFAFSFASLDAGAHTLTVRGTGMPEYGAFVGSISAAVPEPATYGLLLAGLGVVGALAARRRAG